MYATRSARWAALSEVTLVLAAISACVAITWFRTVLVVPAALKRAPAGAAPWQALQTAAQVAAPDAVGVPFTVPDATLVPMALVAVTEQVYIVPFDRPFTTSGEAPPLLVKAP